MLFNFFALQTLGGIIASTLLYIYFKRQNEIQQRIDALGGSTIAIPGWLPFGIDLIFRDVRAAMKNKSMELWQSVFLECNGSRTVEAVVLGQRIVFTSDPQNIQAILSTQFQDFGKGKPFHDDWYEFLGDSIFTTDLQPWHDARQLLRPQFLKRRVSDLHIFERHVEQLLLQFPKDGITFDLGQLFLRYTMDVSTDFLFGTSTGSLEKEGGEFTEAFAEVQRMQNIFVRAGPANKVISRTSFRKGLKVIDDFIAPYINEALSLSTQESSNEIESEISPTFLHGLATHTKDRKVIRDQLVAMLLAGRDTTASALSWLFYELSHNPRIFKRLRQEVIASLGNDRVPLIEDLKGMTYLQNVINEVLRLYPAVPFNVRMALSDTSLPTGGGPHQTAPIGILKDTAIAYSTLVVQRREDLYPLNAPNASSFEPDRWETWRPDTWQYIPFNAGPRICIGQDFAMTEIKYTVVRLLQKISSLESRMLPSEQFMKTSIVMQPGAGVKVAVYRS